MATTPVTQETNSRQLLWSYKVAILETDASAVGCTFLQHIFLGKTYIFVSWNFIMLYAKSQEILMLS